MPAHPSSLISSLSQAPPATVPETAAGLPAALACLPDPRARRGVRHQLTVVVSAAVCAVVAGYRSYAAIAEWVADVPSARWTTHPDIPGEVSIVYTLIRRGWRTGLLAT